LTRVRVRQHVNPLSQKYQTPLILPEWTQIYSNLTQPLHLDIGCARGTFLVKMAQLYPQINFLGIEIREPLVNEANEIRDRLGLTNLHYLFSNINNSLDILLKSLPQGLLKWVTIQFPDPWFKHRHMKRRVVQPELVNILANYLTEEGIVFLQSDIQSVAKEMCERFQANSCFQKQHSEMWLEINPFPIPTEREIATFAKNQPVYRAIFKLEKVKTLLPILKNI
jgi:tRNA (guanine-N7-)-methyltransferase